jgi:hypothetical protein
MNVHPAVTGAVFSEAKIAATVAAVGVAGAGASFILFEGG